MSKKALAGLLMCSILAAAALSASAAGSQNRSSKQIFIGASTLGSQFPAVVALNTGIEQEAKRLGVKVVLLDAQGQAAKQANDVNNLLAQGVQGLIINPYDPGTILSAVKTAIKDHVPVINSYGQFGTSAACVYPGTLGFVGFNNFAMSKQAGQEALKLLPNGGNVAVILGAPGNPNTKPRTEGFLAAIKANPKIKVVASQTGNFQTADSRTAMANILAANSKIDLVYAEDDGEAAGAIEALQAVNRLAGTKVIGLNGFKIGLKNIKEGKQTATFFTSFKAGGAQAVDMLVARLRTGKAPKNPCQSVSSVLVTKANVAQFIPKGEV